MDINAPQKTAEASGTGNERASPNLGLNRGDLAVAIPPAKGARRRREQKISCTEAMP
jgi:hypothetical protein